MSPEERARVVAAALRWRGTPFHENARLIGVGVDCGNLLAAVFEEAGIVGRVEVPLSPRGWHLHSGDERYLRIVLEHAAPASPPWEAGDVLLFRGRRWPSAGHGAIALGDGTVVHAVEGRAVEVWPLSSPLLAGTLWRGFRVGSRAPDASYPPKLAQSEAS